MPTIGTDCHITLTHPDINAGLPYGFILQSEDKTYGPGIVIQQVLDNTVTTIKIFFHVLLADNLINPDGSVHVETRSAMYAVLKQYLSKLADVTLVCSIGAIPNIGATGHVATEYHYSDLSVLVCQVNNAGLYFGPVDLDTFSLSIWDGTLTWASSYWR